MNAVFKLDSTIQEACWSKSGLYLDFLGDGAHAHSFGVDSFLVPVDEFDEGCFGLLFLDSRVLVF